MVSGTTSTRQDPSVHNELRTVRANHLSHSPNGFHLNDMDSISVEHQVQPEESLGSRCSLGCDQSGPWHHSRRPTVGCGTAMAGINRSTKRQEQERLLAGSLSPASLFGQYQYIGDDCGPAIRLIFLSKRILRKTFWEAVEQRPFTYKPIDHMNHCFDALLQVSLLYLLSELDLKVIGRLTVR